MVPRTRDKQQRDHHERESAWRDDRSQYIAKRRRRAPPARGEDRQSEEGEGGEKHKLGLPHDMGRARLANDLEQVPREGTRPPTAGRPDALPGADRKFYPLLASRGD